MKKIAFFILILIVSQLHAQQELIDSLIARLRAPLHDTVRIGLMVDLGKAYYRSGEYDALKQKADEILELSQKINYKKGEASAQNFYGNISWAKGHHSEALEFYDKVIALRQQIGDINGVAGCYSNMGLVYHDLGDYPKALDHYFKSLEIRKKIGDPKGYETPLINIATTYLRIGEKDKALAHALQAVALVEKYFPDRAGVSYNIAGSIYYEKKELKNSFAYFLKAIKMYENDGDKRGIAGVYNNLAGIYADQKKYEQSLTYYSKSLVMLKELEALQVYCVTLNNMGGVYFEQQNYDQSLEYCLESLRIAKQIGSLADEKDAELALYQTKAAMHDYKGALKHYKAYIAGRDSIFNEENTKKAVRYEMNYEFKKKEAETKLLHEKKEVVAVAESKKQKIIIWSVCCVLLLVVGFAVFVYRSYLQKQKANVEIMIQKDIIEAKQKAILDSIHYAKRIQTALMPSDKYFERSLKRLE